MIALYLSVILIWLLFDQVASKTGSTRGEYGFLVCAVVLAATWTAARLVSGQGRAATQALGLGRPTLRSLAASGVISLALVASWLTVARDRVTPIPGALLAFAGMLAQGGVAEEVLFRGFLFGRLRVARSFWRAALLSLPPFLAAHLVLFFRMDVAVAAAATALSLAMTFPLARLYELGGRSVWAAALLHGVVQGTIKIVELPGDGMPLLAGSWMLLSMVLPWAVFLVPLPPESRHGGQS